MTALIGVGSLVSVVPEFLLGSIPRWANGALIRGLIIAAAGAVFYFEKYL